ncbi:MAG TPA: hypothetical protein VLJ17_13435 [Xanthobacteraceae bacterium]|nr:hypothetical protein [Xanthobacteraceae bacterium]
MHRLGWLIAAFLIPPGCGLATDAYAQAPANTAVPPRPTTEYQRKLTAYTQARQKFDDEAGSYWDAVTQKRRLRIAKRRDHQDIVLDDYVLTQPPLYTGPPRPIGPGVPETPPRKYIPVVADFLQSAQEFFDFVPQRPRSEMDFKRAYAKLALAAGLTGEQIVRIYVFETGGNGTYDAQAGLEYSPHGRAVSPALGYNQLLNTNSVELLAERGDEFVALLKARAAGSTGEAKRVLERKVDALRRMIKFCRTVPDDWNAHDALANTPQGLGVHAMLLDVDVGPLLQVQKLLESVAFARRKGHHAPLSAAELEMMNLTGDGNGLDIIMMPAAMRERVPTANFFLRAGYERNPVAIRNNVVAKLLAATNATMDRGMDLPGAKELVVAISGR